MNIYITADGIGIPTGGGTVTYHECSALSCLGDVFQICDRNFLESEHRINPIDGQDPWLWDKYVVRKLQNEEANGQPPYKLAHLYAGTFTETVKYLKLRGTKVSYTAAAHSIEESKKAHEELGIPFQYPHLTDPELWARYVEGYRLADLVICPSYHSLDCMQSYGCKNVYVIPHGCNLPEKTVPSPQRFIVGYLGAYGPDKGVRYLLEAWKKLNYQDGSMLCLGGRDSVSSPFVDALINWFYGWERPIQRLGWVADVSDFYNNIALYVQPSVTEGFGIEVLEAFAHSRPVLCSKGAGAVDLVPMSMRVDAKSSNRLAEMIDDARTGWVTPPEQCLEIARYHTWDKIRDRYIATWKELLK